MKKNLKPIGLVPYDTLSNYRQTFTFKNRRTQEDILPVILLECWKEKVKKRRLLLYSAHYDHLGIRAKEGVLDSIYNGANDDASGVAGILALASHFKKVGHERTLVFAAFTAEEMGLVGSRHFGKE